ncbi:MAG: hypothetical protein AB1430_17330 [Pseudomonadota bacterium]
MGLSAGYIVGAVVSAGAVVHSAEQQRKATHRAQDMAREEAAKAEATATQNANARIQQRRRALSANSLITGGGSSDIMSSGVLNGGKPTLGG